MELFGVLQEQLHERDQAMHELERKMEDKERELHAVRLDNEAVSLNKLRIFSSFCPLLCCL